ncbi:toprim domain-containing protein [Pseudomonas sp. TCU-HL1]|uniref:toprim domain-containing protein n=1 Tax=Pseudomonas sp. TCU-HL1 TaxID=1856685 RepID=UPI00083D8AC8|nr:toprim domain-containing protein [Pseudomonas sp. TCU-HL1]AOE87952.1 topoisomerase [Pseudomonas sp. TCU-HL1]
MDCLSLFREALQAHYGKLDWLPIADGTIRRFHVPGDKPGTRNGAYQLFLGYIASGWFGTWKDGGNWHIWSSRKPANHVEAQLLSLRIERARSQREAGQHQRQQAAAELAVRLWRDARRAAPDHPYLATKGCRSYALRQSGDVLLVPMISGGQLVNLQRIRPNGDKRFLDGGMVTGCYSPLGSISAGKPLYICEGWATGATLHAETGAAVACAMSVGNLLAVGQRLQREHPDAQLIVAGDDDRLKVANPGRTAATQVAAALGCGLIFPPWNGAEPLELSDFNDLAQWRAEQ